MKPEQEQEFIQVIQQYQRLIYKVCSIYAPDKEDQKDLFQEITLQAWKAYPGFKGTSTVSTWLYRVSLNTAINYQRKQKRRPTLTYPELLDHPEDNIPDIYKDEYKVMQQMIAELPKLEKALVLLYLDNKSYKKISEILGVSASNVGTKLNRIKGKMKQQAKHLTQ